MADLNSESQQVTNNFIKLNQATRELIESMQKQRLGESKTHKDAAESVAETAREFDKLNRKQKKYSEELTKMRNAGATDSARYARTARAVQLIEEKKVKTIKGSVAASSLLSKGTTSLISRFNVFGAALSFVINLVGDEYRRHLDLMSAYAGTIEDTGLGFAHAALQARGLAIAHGINAVEFAKMITTSRQVVNALGGTRKAVETMDSVFNDFIILTGGDVNAAMKFAMQQMTNFASVGVRPSSKAMKDFQKDAETLSKQTGMGIEQSIAFYDEMARDTDSLVILRGARESEREAILKSQRAMVQNAIAAGMSADAAKEATKMLNKMVAARPIDRMKQAARMRALGGALGVAGSDEAARALIAGPRATAEQKEALMQFSQSATNMVDRMRGMGLGQEIFATELLGKLDLEQYFGANGTFSTTLGSVMAKPLSEINATMKSLSDMADAQVLAATRRAEMVGKEGLNDPISFIKAISENVEKIFGWTSNFFKNMWNYLKQLGVRIANAVKNLIGLGSKEDEFEPVEIIKESNNKVATAVSSSSQNQKDLAAGIKEQNEIAKTTTKLQEQTAVSSGGMLDSLQKQISSVGTTNSILEQLKKNSDEQLKLAEKQLAAMLTSEQEKSSPELRSRMLSDNRFYTQYGGVS